jgi:hypothetical protein
MKRRRSKMPTEVKGGVELRKALRQFTPDLAKETQKELGAVLRPITNKARGFIPSSSPLSGWANEGNGSWARVQWSTGEAKRGIGFKATPSKPNRNGWRSLARIVNASASGAIYETAGRLNPQGRPQAAMKKVLAPRHENFGKMIRSGSKNESMSNNPYAGKQFIDALNATGEIKNAYRRVEGQAGRSSRKMKGRAIFRAWAEDGGKTNAAVIAAIEKSKIKFYEAVKVK